MKSAKCHPNKKHHCRGLCSKCYAVLWRTENPSANKIAKRKWVKNNKKVVKIIDQNFRKTEKYKLYRKNLNRKFRKQITAYQNKRYQEDVEYKLAAILRSRLNKALKSQNSHKITNTLNLIGCSVTQLKQYLEKRFKIGMSWTNYGKWHIDHKLPCSYFNLINLEEQQKCFHYTNLQPLWALDNLSKSNKLTQ